MPAAPSLDALFAELKAIVEPYAKHFSVFEDTADTYDLEEEMPGNRTQFAVVRKGARDVKLYFYPLHVFPDLRAKVPASLAKKIVHKSVFKLTALTAADRKALVALVAEAWRTIAAIREIDNKRAYHRRFNLDETFKVLKALLVPYAQQFAVGIDQPHWYTLEQQTPEANAEVASLFMRKNELDLMLLPLDVFPKLKVPAVLAPRLTKQNFLRFKTITPAERDAAIALLKAATDLVAAKIKKRPGSPYA